MFLQFGDGFFGLLYLVLNGVFKLFCSKALFFKGYVFFLFTRVIMMTFLCIGVGAGGPRGVAAPPNFGQRRFFGQREKIWAKPVFKDVSMFI